MSESADVAKACFQAYANHDRDALERLIAPDFRFTSPIDNALDREAYFSICWPFHTEIEDFGFIHVVPFGDKVFVTYEILSRKGARFRNSEVLTLQNGKVAVAEVYFGWNIPHNVPEGEHVIS
ncbi:MAG: nuclear transport factor 2 family protein [Pseudomonadota bacterium]